MRDIEFRGKQTDNGEWVYGGANAIVLRKNSPIGKRIKDISTLDFCPECLKAFDAFMNPLRQEVKDNG